MSAAGTEATKERLYFNLENVEFGRTEVFSATASELIKGASTMTTKVTLQDVKRVAELAHLELTPDESQSMLHDLNAILEHVVQLSELDTTSVAPLAQISELDGSDTESPLRQDVVRPSLDRSVVMSEAPETDQVFFKVPKVIER